MKYVISVGSLAASCFLICFFCWGGEVDYKKWWELWKVFNNNLVQIACGYAHSLAVSDTGELFVWGSNHCGQVRSHLDGRFSVQRKKLEYRKRESMGKRCILATLNIQIGCNPLRKKVLEPVESAKGIGGYAIETARLFLWTKLENLLSKRSE